MLETGATKKGFGEDGYDLKVNSTKSMVGHLLGAAGAVECIVCVKSVMEDYIHATAGYRVPDEELDLDYTVTPQTGKPVRYAINNSLGFGGHNGSLLIAKYTGEGGNQVGECN